MMYYDIHLVMNYCVLIMIRLIISSIVNLTIFVSYFTLLYVIISNFTISYVKLYIVMC